MSSPTPSGWRSLLVAAVLIGIANSVVFSVLSDLQDRYGFPDWGLGAIAASGFVVGFLGQMFLAPLADRGHSRSLLLGGLGLAVAGSLLFAASSSLPGLIAARGVVGLSSGLFLPAARAIAATISQDGVGERLGRLSGLELAGFVTGPLVGGLLVDPLGVRWPFVICGLAAGLGAVVLSVASLPSPPMATRRQPASFRMLGQRHVLVGVLLTAGLFLPVGVYDAILDRYLTDLGASNALIGASFVVYGIPFVLLATTGGRWADERGARRIALWATALVAPCTMSYGFLTTPAVILALFAVEGATQAFGEPAAFAMVADAAPQQRAAAAQGLAGAMNLAVAAVISSLTPVVYGRWGPRPVFVGAGALVGACGVLAAALSTPPPTAEMTGVS